jgi:GNAT superfamily N-acetyltransferase
MTEKIAYTAKDLNRRTWPDFEKLFAKHNGVWGGCWCMFYHTTGTFQTKGHGPANKRTKKELVSKGHAHGIIVYREAKPVGWCQYGQRKELPRIDSSNKYPKPVPGEEIKLWRITCFFVEPHNRRRGVGRFALNAALDAIKKEGGGLVEAYPSTKPDQGASLMWPGNVTMFEKAGFQTAQPFGKSHVIMRMKV